MSKSRKGDLLVSDSARDGRCYQHRGRARVGGVKNACNRLQVTCSPAQAVHASTMVSGFCCLEVVDENLYNDCTGSPGPRAALGVDTLSKDIHRGRSALVEGYLV